MFLLLEVCVTDDFFQTAESICGPKWAIARDLSVYDTSVKLAKGVSADRGPPMGRHSVMLILQLLTHIYSVSFPLPMGS